MELSGVKWAIENYENDNSVIVEDTEISHVVNIFNCKNTTIQIKGKINTVTLVQITGITPTIQIDNSDSGQVYLSKQCLGVEIITAKCSAINVSIPEEGEEEGVFVERAVPEMLRTTVQNGKLVTTIVEHSG
ncbi:hypothetical protein FRC09_009955 [Ceratobasidium sp. 395]|nr:hypothetical protein FRC09_009955 [Ceratobasidium sp. 395]